MGRIRDQGWASAWAAWGRAAVVGAMGGAVCLVGSGTPAEASGRGRGDEPVFQRVATFPVFRNAAVDVESVAEIVAAGDAGRLLIYTDSANESVGFVDIRDPADPLPAGLLPLDGEPTSVAVAGRHALVAVNTSESFTDPSGQLDVVDLRTLSRVRSIDLGGQPDSVAVSPNGRFAAVVIENERDEDLGDGRPPQAPPGSLVIVDLVGPPSRWRTREVSLVGVTDLFPGDPEPEFVDINRLDVAVVSLQENNHVVLVHLPTGRILREFEAGTADLDQVDTLENDLIELDDTLVGVPREPDAVAWISPLAFATADEGDLDGGSRGFSIFSATGRLLFSSGNELEHLVTRIGHYPEGRSENKGNEPEAVEYGRFGSRRLLFVGSERSSVVAVYRLRAGRRPELVQVLPAGVGPEGVLAIPERDLLAVASENDDRDAGFRGTISLYRLQSGPPAYPTIRSADRSDGTPIPFAALSALAAHPSDPDRLFTVYDSFFAQSRIFTIDASRHPAVIDGEIVLRVGAAGDTLDLDPEGIATRQGGGFWVVSEGAGSVDDPDRPVESLNLLLRVAPDGRVEEIVQLPDAVNALQRRFGFEGVASVGTGDDELVYVAFQREWVGDPDRRVRIGRYAPASGEWTFFYYPIEAPTSPLGGFVGLSEIVALDAETFAVVERDNRAGSDARIKTIHRFSVAGLDPQPQGGVFPEVSKELVRDLIPDLVSGGGPVLEKVEGLAVAADGGTYIVTDNDGVEDSSGETQFLNLGAVFD